MTFPTHTYDAHIQTVEIVTDVGVPPPRKWRDLFDRWNNYLQPPTQTPIRDRLIKALLDGDKTADLAALKAAAMGESAPFTTVAEAVHHAVFNQLRQLYDGAAAYKQVSKLFNEAVTRMLLAAEIVDLEADLKTVIDMGDEQRQAFKNGEIYCNEIEKLVPALCASATLASNFDIMPGTTTLALPLTCEVTPKNRVAAWRAFTIPIGATRCGRWFALSKVATIRACDDLAQLTDVQPAGAYEVANPPQATGDDMMTEDGRPIRVDMGRMVGA